MLPRSKAELCCDYITSAEALKKQTDRFAALFTSIQHWTFVTVINRSVAQRKKENAN